MLEGGRCLREGLARKGTGCQASVARHPRRGRGHRGARERHRIGAGLRVAAAIIEDVEQAVAVARRCPCAWRVVSPREYLLFGPWISPSPWDSVVESWRSEQKHRQMDQLCRLPSSTFVHDSTFMQALSSALRPFGSKISRLLPRRRGLLSSFQFIRRNGSWMMAVSPGVAECCDGR